MNMPLNTMRPVSTADGHLSDQMGLAVVLEAVQELAGQVEFPKLLDTLTKIMIENAGAQRGYFLLPEGDQWEVTTTARADASGVQVSSVRPGEATLPMTIIHYAARTREPVLINEPTRSNPFAQDPYLISAQPKSILCLPILHQRKLAGMVYMENHLTPNAFAPERLEVLKLLATQAGVALQNARLYTNLQQAEASARANEQRFRHLFENAPLCIFEVDVSSTPAVIIAANRRAEAVYGWSGPEFADLTLEQIVPPKARRAINRLIEHVSAGETVAIETSNRHRDGTIFPVRVIATPETEMGPHANHVVVAVEDITAQMQRRSEAEAIDEERRRIAQEIHDGVVQDLAALRLRASLWYDWVQASPAQAQAELAELQAILDREIAEIRRAIFALRPVALDEVGFFPALRQLAADFDNLYQFYVDLHIAGDEECLPSTLELPLFRIVQEALSNVSKHAQASLVWIGLNLTQDEAVRLAIRDNGLGFDPNGLEETMQGGHLGLKQMRERVEKAGGTLVIDSQPGQGTEVRVVLPVG
jgi:PAS domain S-box-containing protein